MFVIYMAYYTQPGTECYKNKILNYKNKYPSQFDKKIQSLVVCIIF